MLALIMRQQMPNTAPVKPKPPVEQPVLLEAINLTFRTMERRARLYRNLVVAVSLTMIASVVVGIILRRWVVLLGMLALPIYVRGYLSLDNRLVMGWRRDVLRMQDTRGLNVAQLTQTLAGLKNLPQEAL